MIELFPKRKKRAMILWAREKQFLFIWKRHAFERHTVSAEEGGLNLEYINNFSREIFPNSTIDKLPY